eukprot:scaffold16159_cov125-Skeletonema_dohrnii-CCMP3373.AAC.4
MGQPIKAGRTPRRRRWAVLISGGTSLLLLMVVIVGSLVAFALLLLLMIAKDLHKDQRCTTARSCVVGVKRHFHVSALADFLRWTS